jgi:hypothetical protein
LAAVPDAESYKWEQAATDPPFSFALFLFLSVFSTPRVPAYPSDIMKFSAALISTALFALTASAAPAVSIETRDVATDVGLFFGFIGGYGVQAGMHIFYLH